MSTFVTLGPPNSNHDFVLRRYLRAHGLLDLERVRIELVDDFHQGARMLIDGRADFMLQCAAHPSTAEITGAFRRQVFVVDAFISRSRPMPLLMAQDHDAGQLPRRVGLQPATREYADLSRWSEAVLEPTVTAVGEGLLAKKYEAGIAFSSLLEEYPERFQVLEDAGAICDAWVVFGTAAVDRGKAVVWTDSPPALRSDATNRSRHDRHALTNQSS